MKDPVTGRIRGALYQNPIDCLWKTFKTEGVAGWYKGTTAHFLRIFPHTVVTLVANEVSGISPGIERRRADGVDHHEPVSKVEGCIGRSGRSTRGPIDEEGVAQKSYGVHAYLISYNSS